ncbi:MAG: hypothetical protein NZM35_05530 [Chitinophagales bacterium]|nr:hypothetical protein [Chitinophagales bacterium]
MFVPFFPYNYLCFAPSFVLLCNLLLCVFPGARPNGARPEIFIQSNFAATILRAAAGAGTEIRRVYETHHNLAGSNKTPFIPKYNYTSRLYHKK